MPADEPATFDPERIIAVLDAHAVEGVIVGGFGAQAHGARRQTFDIDVVPRDTDENFSRLAAALRGLVIHLAALDDIVASKEFANRDKDLDALPELRELQQRRASP